MGNASLETAASRLAALLGGQASSLSAPGDPDLAFEPVVEVRPLVRAAAPPGDVWAVDGGQALVADARCLQLYVTRAATVRYVGGSCVVEDEGELRATLLGGEAERVAAVGGLGVPAASAVDVNLLRDREEWAAVDRAVDACDAGGFVLVDGDLQPDWRIPSSFLASLLERAAGRDVVLAGVTKHSSLARGGAPLLGALEREAEERLGPRSLWWAPVARSRADVGGGGVRVVAARLDPDARFSFRVDLPATVDPEAALASLSALCDDAAFPGYPYPLAVADRLAACPGWLRADVRSELDELVAAAGVPEDVRERAFADRHGFLERS